jgi:phage FluMu gp28-like protein
MAAKEKSKVSREPGEIARLEALRRDYFLPYQIKWIKDDSPLKLYPKSRRIGVTYATSYRCMRKCLANDKLTQWVSSKDLGLAQEFVQQYVRKWCELANIVASGLAGDDVVVLGNDPKTGVEITAFQVRFPNGSRIMSLSSNPRAFAGKGGDILIDEMDLHEDQAPLYDMAMPCTDWGGQLEIVSAYDPQGSSETVFAKLVEEAKHGNPKGWALHETTLEDAVAEGLVEKINAAKEKRGYKAQTREEFVAAQYRKCRTLDARNSQYKCIPVNAGNQMAVRREDLTYAKKPYSAFYRRLDGDAKAGQKIDPVVQELLNSGFMMNLLIAYPGCSWSFGVDIARTNDLASLWIDARKGDMATLAGLVNLRNCKFEGLEQLCRRALEILPGCVGRGDSTGLGMQMCEDLTFDYPDQFQGVNFSSGKNELGTLLIEAFEKGWQTIPTEPLEIAEDISCVRKMVSSSSSKAIFEVVENQYEPDSHGDMAWACAMSKKAIADTKGSGDIRADAAERGGRKPERSVADYIENDDDDRQDDVRGRRRRIA